jgi:hypothetical protein
MTAARVITTSRANHRAKVTMLGQRMKHVFLVVLVCMATRALAASPEEILNSDEILDQARADVAKMKADELRMFADSPAQCVNSLSDNELIQNACYVSRERYFIEAASSA